MDGQRFDAISKGLASSNSRRATLRAVTAGVLAAGLSALGLHEAAAKCNKEGKKCKKQKECCSKKCKGGKCRCHALREKCTGTSSTAGNSCCGDAYCTTNACGEQTRCCQNIGNTCNSTCDCCLTGAECQSGAC